MPLDFKTIVIAVTLFEFVVGAFTAIAGRSFRQQDRGLQFWGYLLLFQAVNWAVFLLWGKLPPDLMRFVAPILQVATLWGFSILLRRFLGKRPYHLTFAAFLSALVVWQIIFVFVHPSEPYRIMGVGFISVILSTELVWVTARKNAEFRYVSHKLFAFAHASLTMTLFLRLNYFILTELGLGSLLPPRVAMESVATLSMALCFCLSAYALLLMYKDRYFELKNLAESEKAKSETEFQMVRDSVSVMLWRLDEKGDISWVNRAWTNFTGQNLTLAKKSDWLELVHPEDRQKLAATVGDTIGARRTYHAEYRLLRRDGAYRWVLETGFPLRDDHGLVRGFMGSTIDITETREMELALLANAAKLRATFRILPVGITIMNQERQITEINEALAKILGLDEESVKSGNLKGRTFIHADGRRLLPEEWPSNIALRDGRSVSETEIGVCDEYGDITWLAVSAEPLPAPQSGVVIATRDITDQKRHLREIEVLSAELMRISEAERAQIAGELHDSLGQCLVLSNLRLKAALQHLPGISEADRVAIAAPIKQALVIARDISHKLSPLHLQSLGMRMAVEELVHDVSAAGVLEASVQLSALDEFPENWNIDFYRIVQEALTNIVKHAEAHTIAVRAEREDTTLSLIITDDGKGVVANPGSPGLGQLLMQQRARHFNGRVLFEQLNPGYSVRIEVPVPKQPSLR